MKKIIKRILFVSYVENKGLRRICFILGCLLAFLPAYVFLSEIYINREYKTLRDSVVFANEIQKEYVFNKYKYSCNECRASKDFEHWKKVFTDYQTTRSFLEEDCQNLPYEKDICKRVQDYLLQPVSIKYFNFTVLHLLKWALIMFYIPFILACAIKWVVSGFKQSKKQKKSKK